MNHWNLPYTKINVVGLILCIGSFFFCDSINFVFDRFIPLSYLNYGQYFVLDIGIVLALLGRLDNISKSMIALFFFRAIDEITGDLGIVNWIDILEAITIIYIWKK